MKAVESYFHDHLVVVGGVGVGIAFIQVCQIRLCDMRCLTSASYLQLGCTGQTNKKRGGPNQNKKGEKKLLARPALM